MPEIAWGYAGPMLQTPRASLFGQVYKRWHNLLENISEHQKNIRAHKTQVRLYKEDFRMPNPDISVDHSECNHNQGRKWNFKRLAEGTLELKQIVWEAICIREFLIWETKKMHYRHIYKTFSSIHQEKHPTLTSVLSRCTRKCHSHS